MKHGVWGRLKSPINTSLYLKGSVFTRAQHTWRAQRSQYCGVTKALSPLRRSQWWGHRQGSELSLQQPHTGRLDLQDGPDTSETLFNAHSPPGASGSHSCDTRQTGQFPYGSVLFTVCVRVCVCTQAQVCWSMWARKG